MNDCLYSFACNCSKSVEYFTVTGKVQTRRSGPQDFTRSYNKRFMGYGISPVYNRSSSCKAYQEYYFFSSTLIYEYGCLRYCWQSQDINQSNDIANKHLDSKVQGANMGPTWVLSAPDGPHDGPMNSAIRDNPAILQLACSWLPSFTKTATRDLAMLISPILEIAIFLSFKLPSSRWPKYYGSHSYLSNDK